MKKEKTEIPLLVTTKHKGVFFGYAVPCESKTITLKNARMCVYWSMDVKGVLGLAVTGPSKTCRVGPEVLTITLQDVTSITECSKESVSAWEIQPWN
jgi:hypothetical protein